MNALAYLRLSCMVSLLQFACLSVLAQESDNRGKKFWFALPDPGSGQYEVVVSGKNGTILTLRQPSLLGGLSLRDTIKSTRKAVFTISDTSLFSYENTENAKGLVLEADADVSVLLVIRKDGAIVEGTSISAERKLGNAYTANTYYGAGLTQDTRLTIIATRDSSRLAFYPAANTSTWRQGKRYEVIMDAGEVLQLAAQVDLSGTRILSIGANGVEGEGHTFAAFVSNKSTSVCRPIQVANQHLVLDECTMRPNTLIDQLLPDTKLGKQFPIVPFNVPGEDVIKIVALHDQTTLQLNGLAVREINAANDTLESIELNQFGQITLALPNRPDGSLKAYYLVSSQPISVLHISRSQNDFLPLQCFLPAFERRSTHLELATEPGQRLIFTTPRSASVQINGRTHPLGWFKPMQFAPDLSFTIFEATDPITTIACEQGVQVFACQQAKGGDQVAYSILTGEIDWLGDAPFTAVSGIVYNEMAADCEMDAWERTKPLSGMLIKATPGPFFARTDASGLFRLDLPSGGEYTISQLMPSDGHQLYEQTCPTNGDGLHLSLDGSGNPIAGLRFGNKVKHCPHLVVDVAPFKKRRCMASTTLVRYANEGFNDAYDSEVTIIYPEHIVPIRSTPAWDHRNGDTLIWQVGTLKAKSEQFYISIKDSVVCGDESIRGKSQCFHASIAPYSDCIDDDGLWDESDLRLNAVCTEKNGIPIVRFTIKNIGSGNMQDSTDYLVYINEELILMDDRIKLSAGDSTQIEVSVNDYESVRMEVKNTKHHPYRDKAVLTVENCGMSGEDQQRIGYVLRFGQADDESHLSSYCTQIRDSYDPNDKLGLPVGFGEEHFITGDEPIKFKIRFQNTGNDTAYNVRIEDQLHANLDLATLKMGAASHPFDWTLTQQDGQPVMVCYFEDIFLPDSATDLAGSQGFVSFQINPLAQLVPGEQITNQAGIYFDFNSPIITNTVHYTIWEGHPVSSERNRIRIVGQQPLPAPSEQPRFSIYPNPFGEQIFIQLDLSTNNGEASSEAQADIYDSRGRLIHREMLYLAGGKASLHLAHLPTGMYLIRLQQVGARAQTIRIIKN